MLLRRACPRRNTVRSNSGAAIRGSSRIYVSGLLVAEEENFAFSYNITSLTALKTSEIDELKTVTDEFLELVGRDSLRGLAPEYEHGDRLDEVISETNKRISQLMHVDDDVLGALSRFSEDNAVRIMTIHKSKGLAFDTVVVLGVETETFWGKAEEERSAFIVGISRAKRRLVLTVADHRERPGGYRRRWDEDRTPHEELLSYATETM